jgi:hypothetical protein
MKFKLPDGWRSMTEAELSALMLEAAAAGQSALSAQDGEALEAANAGLATIQAELETRTREAALENRIVESVSATVADTVKDALSTFAAALADGASDDDGDADVDPADDADATPADADLADDSDAADDEGEGDADDDDDADADDDGGDDADADLSDDGAPGDLSDADTKLPAQPKRNSSKLVSVRETSSFKNGQALTDLELATMYHEVARTLSTESAPMSLATIDYSDEIGFLTGDPEHDQQVMLEAIGRHRMGGEFVDWVASGGWGTPSTIDYGFFELEGTPETVDLPRVGISRGGLQYLDGGGPTLADILGTDALWEWTEALDIAATGNDPDLKTMLKLPIPDDWTDVRLAAWGIALENGNLIARSWPEHTRRWNRLGLLGHTHYINDTRVARMSAGSTQITQHTAVTGDAFINTLLESIEYQAEWLREKYRMDKGATFEAVLPLWALPALRADLTRRQGVDLLEAPVSRIQSLMAGRGIRVQFTHGYQSLTSDSTGAGRATGAPYPETMKYMIYPSGTWVIGAGGSLTLGVQRHKEQVEKNDHTMMWTEDFLSLMKFGPVSREVTVSVNAHGGTAGAIYA